MVKKILPPIDDKNQIANLASAGDWKSEDASFLEKLATGSFKPSFTNIFLTKPR